MMMPSKRVEARFTQPNRLPMLTVNFDIQDKRLAPNEAEPTSIHETLHRFFKTYMKQYECTLFTFFVVLITILRRHAGVDCPELDAHMVDNVLYLLTGSARPTGVSDPIRF